MVTVQNVAEGLYEQMEQIASNLPEVCQYVRLVREATTILGMPTIPPLKTMIESRYRELPYASYELEGYASLTFESRSQRKEKITKALLDCYEIDEESQKRRRLLAKERFLKSVLAHVNLSEGSDSDDDDEDLDQNSAEISFQPTESRKSTKRKAKSTEASGTAKKQKLSPVVSNTEAGLEAKDHQSSEATKPHQPADEEEDPESKTIPLSPPAERYLKKLEKYAGRMRRRAFSRQILAARKKTFEESVMPTLGIEGSE